MQYFTVIDEGRDLTWLRLVKECKGYKKLLKLLIWAIKLWLIIVTWIIFS